MFRETLKDAVLPEDLPTVKIVSVVSKRDFRRFVNVPWQVYDRTRHPQWVAPLRSMVRGALDTKRNPFYQHADIQLFLAERSGRVVGRIAAIENRAHNRFHEDSVGFFGFLELEDDQEVADALIDSASRWLAGRGLTTMQGPVSPSTNHECGLLVGGFEEHPMIMTPWNPPYYEGLVEGAGLTQVKDLLGYLLPMDNGFALPDRFERIAERTKAKLGLTFRAADVSRYESEVKICWEIYNEAWTRNWGFVPVTWEEWEFAARGLKHILRPEFAFIAEIDGVPAGFMLIVSDLNRILRRVPSGRLSPLAMARIFFGISKIKRGRVFALGVKAEYRTRGIVPLFFHEAVRRARAINAIEAEASWVLEDNDAMRAMMETVGSNVYRRWRMYQKPIPLA